MEDQLIISPLELGMPAKFREWRRGQSALIMDGVECPARFFGPSAPTGIGKSPAYIAIAKLTGRRTIILTATKGLQDQLLTDFGEMGLVDIRGKSNYPCTLGADMTCEDGMDARCPYIRDKQGSNCPWRCAQQRAAQSDLVVSNYPCWILNNMYGEGWGTFGMMVCDEAHSADTEVCEAISISFFNYEIYGMMQSRFPEPKSTMDEWQRWATLLHPHCEAAYDHVLEEVKRLGPESPKAMLMKLRHLRNLVRKFLAVITAAGEWVSSQQREGWKLEPVWASDYADAVLFCNIPKVIPVSATLTEMSLHLLGIKEDYWYIEYPAIFPPENSPLIWVPTARMSFNSDAYDLTRVILTMDDLIGARLDRKGVCHTVSFDRRDMIYANSRYADIMITHQQGDSTDTMRQVALFKRAKPPAVFLSPSVSTGYDFPGDECEYQLLPKIPFPPRKASPVLEARAKANKRYMPYLTAQTLVQMCGRGTRSEKDTCENLVTDNMIKFVMRGDEYKGLIPSWFRRLYKPMRDGTLPKPLPKQVTKGET